MRFQPSDFPIPCALLRLPWKSDLRISSLISPKPRKREEQEVLSFLQDYVERMLVEEVCADPPLYVIRFGYNQVEQQEIFSAIFTVEQLMSVQHSLASCTEPSFVGSARYTILKANPDDAAFSQQRIFLLHHVLDPFEKLPLDYRVLEAFFVERIYSKVLHFLNSEEAVKHLIIFVDASQTASHWMPEHMALITHLVCQLTAITCSLLPLKIGAPKGFASFQIVIVPCTSFSEGVKGLRNESVCTDELERGSDTGSRHDGRNGFCKATPFLQPEVISIVEYIGVPKQSRAARATPAAKLPAHCATCTLQSCSRKIVAGARNLIACNCCHVENAVEPDRGADCRGAYECSASAKAVSVEAPRVQRSGQRSWKLERLHEPFAPSGEQQYFAQRAQPLAMPLLGARNVLSSRESTPPFVLRCAPYEPTAGSAQASVPAAQPSAFYRQSNEKLNKLAEETALRRNVAVERIMSHKPQQAFRSPMFVGYQTIGQGVRSELRRSLGSAQSAQQESTTQLAGSRAAQQVCYAALAQAADAQPQCTGASREECVAQTALVNVLPMRQ